MLEMVVRKPKYKAFSFAFLLVFAFLLAGLLAQQSRAFAQQTLSINSQTSTNSQTSDGQVSNNQANSNSQTTSNNQANNGRAINVYTNKAVKSLGKEKYKQSIKQFNKALQLLEAQNGLSGNAETERLSKIASLKEKFALTQYKRGLKLSEKGADGKAIYHFTKAIKLDPNLRVVYQARSLALHKKGRVEEAQNDLFMVYDFQTMGTPSNLKAAQKSLKQYMKDHRIAPPKGGLDPIATIDTGAKANAWGEGWTGKGVGVAIMDNFLRVPNGLSHGHWVGFVALSVAPEINIKYQSYSISRNVAGCNPTNEPLVGTGTATLLKRHNVDYCSFSREGFHIINQSFSKPRAWYNRNGIIRSFSNSSWNLFALAGAKYDASIQSSAQQADKPTGLHKNVLFVKIAGNFAEICQKAKLGTETAKCNLRSASLLKLRETNPDAGDRIIFVGALADDDGDRTTPDVMASYSNIAGALKNDFIVAHDDVLNAGEGEGGTSYAAPRVTGAAALVRHKFPNLDGAALKQVLLQTAQAWEAVRMLRLAPIARMQHSGMASSISQMR